MKNLSIILLFLLTVFSLNTNLNSDGRLHFDQVSCNTTCFGKKCSKKLIKKDDGSGFLERWSCG